MSTSDQVKEAALRQSERLLELVLATLPVGVIVTDKAGDVVLSNAASVKVWGAKPIASGPARLARSEGRWHDSGKKIEPDEWASKRALTLGETSLNELIDINTYDGEPKVIQNSAAPVRSSDGTIVGAVVVNEDVTERVKAEQALRESARRLQYLSRRLLEIQEAERRYLALELHDEFGQLLATINLRLHAALGVAGDAARPGLEEAIALLQQAGNQVRSLALELRPTMLEGAGLDVAVHWLADQIRQRSAIVIDVSGHLKEVEPDVAIAFFRVVQEALTNVVRHANARHVRIVLGNGSALEISIQDDGVGFDVDQAADEAVSRGSLGLLGMRERMHMLGGGVDVVSQPGSGTRIRVWLPLGEDSTEDAGAVR
jgi:two-component system, NarL family, sensor histidine kinase UhpB